MVDVKYNCTFNNKKTNIVYHPSYIDCVILTWCMYSSNLLSLKKKSNASRVLCDILVFENSLILLCFTLFCLAYFNHICGIGKIPLQFTVPGITRIEYVQSNISSGFLSEITLLIKHGQSNISRPLPPLCASRS